MNSEERFRKSLEDLLNTSSFPFDENNWQEARRMIDASKNRRRIAPFIIGGVFLLASLLGGLYFLYETPVAPAEKMVSATKEEATLVVPEKITPASESSLPAKPVKKSVPTSGTGSSLRVSGTPQTLPPADDVVSSPQQAAVPEQAQPSSVPTEAAPIEVTPVKAEAINNSPAPELKVAEPAPVNVAVNASPLETHAAKTTTNEQVPAEDPAPRNNPAEVPVAVASANNPVQPQVPVTENPGAEQFASDQPNSQPFKNETAQEPDAVKPNPELVVVAPAADPVGEKSLAGPASAQAADSVKVTVPDLSALVPADNDQGQLLKPKVQPVLFSVEAGANYMFGWKNPETRDAQGFNPTIGVNYFNNFKSKMSISIGLHYSSVGSLSYSSYSSRVVRLGLGEETRVTIYTPLEVHYLLAPLRFNYNVNAMNAIGLGCNIAYLLTVQSEVETYTEKMDGQQYGNNLEKTTGYTQGFKPFDTQISVFYKRRLYPNLAVNMELFFGLTDIKANHFFDTNNSFERNSGLKLTLVYNFLKK